MNPESENLSPEDQRAMEDALRMEGMDPSDSPSPTRELEEGETPKGPPRTNMPLILSASVPGLGHALYGAPTWGIAAVVLTLTLVLVTIYAFVVALFLLLGGQPFLRPLVILGALLVYGLVFTGLVAWDARELEDRDGQVTGSMHAAVGSAMVVVPVAVWLLG